MKIKVYLPHEGSLDDNIYLEGAFQITIDKKGNPISIRTSDKRILIVGLDCDIEVSDNPQEG